MCLAFFACGYLVSVRRITPLYVSWVWQLLVALTITRIPTWELDPLGNLWGQRSSVDGQAAGLPEGEGTFTIQSVISHR